LKQKRLATVLLFLTTTALLVASCGGPSEENAEAYVLETLNNPMYADAWWFLDFPLGDGMAPEVIEDGWGRAKLKGDCATLRISTGDETDTVFLHWDEGEWNPDTVFLGSSQPFHWLSGYNEYDHCFYYPDSVPSPVYE
jgi:hypothetical protein